MKCSHHPLYRGKKKPRKRRGYPYGCDDCWKVYQSRVFRDVFKMLKDV